MSALLERLRSMALIMPVCLALGLMLPAGSAGAQDNAGMVKASDPETVVKALQEGGYPAELVKDDVGDPQISSTASGLKFVVFFYHCDDHINCRSIRLHAGFRAKEAFTPQQANDWNKARLFTKVYLNDDNDPRLVLDIRTGEGIPVSVFDTQMKMYDADLATFAKQVGL